MKPYVALNAIFPMLFHHRFLAVDGHAAPAPVGSGGVLGVEALDRLLQVRADLTLGAEASAAADGVAVRPKMAYSQPFLARSIW